jgi:hypothetical protein
VVDTTAWVELAKSLGERKFLARHPGFFLLTTSGPDELSSLYSTISSVPASTPGRLMRRTVGVRWIHRTRETPEASDGITVGRAGDCDVGFLHPSVSKLHARFDSEGSRLTLTDLGSRNGTKVNGELLARDQAQIVKARDRVEFGLVQTLVLDGRELFEVLGRMF